MIERLGKYTIFPTEMGWMGLVSTGRGIFASILPQSGQNSAELQLLSRVPFKPVFSPQSFKKLEEILQAYFRGECREIKCDIDWSWATPFQKRVLQTVRSIPAGSYLTYGELASMVGSPGGARAVGNALAANMVPCIIPCHRVIRKNGTLGGFTGADSQVKARLLFLEGADINNKLKGKQGT